MPSYVILDAHGKYENFIVCDEDWVLPEGYTKLLVDEQHYWDNEKQELILRKNVPIKIESI